MNIPAPTGLRIYPGLTSASATWDNSGLNSFEVAVSGLDTNGKNVTRVFTNNDNTFYIHSGLVPGEEYRLSVVATRFGQKSPAVIGRFTTHTAELGAPSASSPPTSPVDTCDKCTDNDDCVANCPTKTYCVSGECQVCDPNKLVSTDSDCYTNKQVCVMTSDGPQCKACVTDESCVSSYGNSYVCDEESGRCHTEMSPPPTTSKSHTGLIIGIMVGILVLFLVLGILIFVMTGHKKHGSVPSRDIYAAHPVSTLM